MVTPTQPWLCINELVLAILRLRKKEQYNKDPYAKKEEGGE